MLLQTSRSWYIFNATYIQCNIGASSSEQEEQQEDGEKKQKNKHHKQKHSSKKKSLELVLTNILNAL